MSLFRLSLNFVNRGPVGSCRQPGNSDCRSSQSTGSFRKQQEVVSVVFPKKTKPLRFQKVVLSPSNMIVTQATFEGKAARKNQTCKNLKMSGTAEPQSSVHNSISNRVAAHLPKTGHRQPAVASDSKNCPDMEKKH